MSREKYENILFLVSSMSGGGAERVAALLCNYWALAGHKVTLLLTFSGRSESSYPLDSGVDVVCLADLVPSNNKSFAHQCNRLIKLRQAIRTIGPSVIISFMYNVNIAAICATVGLGMRVIVSERIYPPLSAIPFTYKILRALTYPLATAVAMQTRDGLQWLRINCPLAHGVLIPNPLAELPVSDPQVAPSCLVQSHRRFVLAAGRLDKQKQFHLLIEAFVSVSLSHPEVDLVILGEGPERGALEARTVELGLSNRVHLPGRVGNIGAWFEQAAAFALTSRAEGFPNALLEAQAYGVPAVSFDCQTGPNEIITHGVSGILVPPSEGSQGFGKVLGDLLSADWPCMAKHRVKLGEQFGIARIAAQWLAMR